MKNFLLDKEGIYAGMHGCKVNEQIQHTGLILCSCITELSTALASLTIQSAENCQSNYILKISILHMRISSIGLVFTGRIGSPNSAKHLHTHP